MKQDTLQKMEKVIALIGGREITYGFLQWAANEAQTTIKTIKKYCEIETITPPPVEFTVQELLDFLNDMAGEDCYYGHWNFQLIDGKIYDTAVESTYKIIGLKAED